jgi:hypothetical protein
MNDAWLLVVVRHLAMSFTLYSVEGKGYIHWAAKLPKGGRFTRFDQEDPFQTKGGAPMAQTVSITIQYCTT